jgi:outer membrane protein assembly factor BamE (lipoprotein component of BamABCDE complex)
MRTILRQSASDYPFFVHSAIRGKAVFYLLLAGLLVMASALAGCSPTQINRGNADLEESVKSLEVGNTRQNVLEKLGSPSTTTNFDGETWYYMSARKTQRAFFNPSLEKQTVTRIRFDEGGTVTSIDRFTEEDVRKVEVTKRETPTEGHEMGVIEQLLGNVGRFNQPGRESDVPR